MKVYTPQEKRERKNYLRMQRVFFSISEMSGVERGFQMLLRKVIVEVTKFEAKCLQPVYKKSN